jgi:putative salt-induced outer membrane protein YdiY
MRGMLKWLGFILICIVLSSGSALADVIHLRNGDRISGKVVSLEEGKLVVKTDYAGEVTISWDKVESLSADGKINVVLEDGTTLKGQTLPMEAGKMKLETENLQEASAFNLTDVKAINPKVKPPVRITARINVGLELERGNTDADDYDVEASFQARTKKSRYWLGGEFNKEKTRGELTAEDWEVYANYDYFISERWFAYIRTKFEHDEFADLDLRSTLGAGAGYQFFESDELNLSFGTGPGYISENYIEAGDNTFASVQWLTNYDQFFFDKLFQLFHRSDGYVNLDDTADWIINTRQGVRFPLYKGLTVTLQYEYDYESRPSPDATADYDSKWNLLLGYVFKN